ncbi:amidohydrolase [Planctomicrobium sp. SH527]|uniref:amidohydrolase n=1 Tax=Planctomicrobium sp. SH527 TaxID=3448123 RepID=UPI003F5B50C4
MSIWHFLGPLYRSTLEAPLINFRCVLLLGVVLGAAQFQAVQADDSQKKINEAVQSLSVVGWENACKIWGWAEPGYQEKKSAALLADWLEQSGFRVKRGVGGIPTAFTAEIGTGSPVIAILGEYDALPGLSQDAVPVEQPRDGTIWGHGCGHHLFGVASAMAAISLADDLKSGKLKGTVRFYGCPAEEGGSAKAFMVRDGLFNDVDVALHWHPSSGNSAADKSTLARIAVRFRYHGTSAHAAGAPEQGRSALDAVEVLNYAANLMREHMPQQARMHYVITNGGKAPNVVPNEAEVYYYIRHPNAEVVRELYGRLVKCAEAGALATETRLEVKHEGGIMELLPNQPLSEQVEKRFAERLNIKLTESDVEFAQRIQTTLAKPLPLDRANILSKEVGASVVSMGSTDVGDVSWVTPTAGFSVCCWAPGTPGHSWQAVACGKMDLARQGMVLAAQILAATTSDLLTTPELVEQAKADFDQRIGKRKYNPLIAPDQAPPLDYRNNLTGATP